MRTSSLPKNTVLSLSSKTVGVPAVTTPAAGATSLHATVSMLTENAAVGVPAVMEAATGWATGATSLPTDATLSEMVSVPSVTVGCGNDVVAVVRGGRCRPTGSDGSSGCGTTIIG